ncbi:glutathione hydrolase 7 isoform X2 [Leptinotarsa decemlineata]|uniref:glutathione hydrolase 7 isoform X2 n=1 Tax=Leptinotarsa decemlineata TaxID=7539 RepID=UPI003D30990B
MTTVGELVTENREDIPLKQGKKSRKWYACNEDLFSGSKYITFAFSTLTIIITLALLIQIYYGDYQVVPHGSVATDSLECSKIGTTILKNGGNAVDAAIASAFCLSVVTPHVTGLDAEGHLLIYDHKTRLPPNVIDFSDSSAVSEHLPRLILGLAFTHKHFGRLPWKDLVEPAALLARQGYVVSPMLVKAITISKSEDLYGQLEPGQLLLQEYLAATLDKISSISEDELYNFLNEMNRPQITQANQVTFNKHYVFVPSSTSIGPLVGSALNKIAKLNFTKEESQQPEYLYHLADISKTMFIENQMDLKFHHGTFSNVAVIDKDDKYVSLVTGMYGLFGSGEMTAHGYVLDVKNKTKPSSRVAMIVTDGILICGRRMVFGANDLTSSTEMITSLLTANENITESIEAPRFYILTNGTMGTERAHSPYFSNETIKYFKLITPDPIPVAEPYQSINIVEKVKDNLSSHSDSRGGGIAVRF